LFLLLSLQTSLFSSLALHNPFQILFLSPLLQQLALKSCLLKSTLFLWNFFTWCCVGGCVMSRTSLTCSTAPFVRIRKAIGVALRTRRMNIQRSSRVSSSRVFKSTWRISVVITSPFKLSSTVTSTPAILVPDEDRESEKWPYRLIGFITTSSWHITLLWWLMLMPTWRETILNKCSRVSSAMMI
jgi:hypothetical protein